MKRTEYALAVWANACDFAGIRWYLFREALLCAQGYGEFPETLKWAQIAVFGEDFSRLAEQVFSKLPDTWKLETINLGAQDPELIFYQNGEPVLEVCVLYGAADTTQIDAAYARLLRIFRKSDQLRLWNKVGNLFSFYERTVGKYIQRKAERLSGESYPQLINMLHGTGKEAAVYSDILEVPLAAPIARSLFSDVLMLRCGKHEYPVFSGYKEYLAQKYGDYKAGINDDIGCGLTVEEKEQLRAHQERCFEALSFLQDISKEFDLQYYLLAGSVLGCVRHGGFIPWDDDIDIGIRIDKLKKFEEVVKEQLPLRLPEGFALVQSGPNNPYPRMFSKICFEGRGCIDLWPLVPTYEDGLKAKFLWYFGKLITKVHYGKIGYKVTKYRKIVNLLCKVMTDHMIMALARYNERKYAKRKTPAYINLYSIYRREKETIKREWLDDEATAKFRDLEVPVVGCTDAYLTHLYGDYMAFPAPWKRASRHSERFFSEE